MVRVFFYSLLLLAGIVLAMLIDLSGVRFILTNITTICLAYIMIEVGLEFTLNKDKLSSYGKDYLIAFTAASFPWIFCALYFIFVLDVEWREALLIGRFAAPTSAGILFTMLAAAGLATTWLFKKARILAIFDDIDTILLMIPLQIMIVGIRWELFLIIPILLGLLWIAYRFLHKWHLPVRRWMLLLYGLILVVICESIFHFVQVQIEVLLPAFILGCILYNPHDPEKPSKHIHEHAYIEPERPAERRLDFVIKSGFMFLVGLSLPRVQAPTNGVWILTAHVVAITLLANIGKFFPAFCYRNEASVKERIALATAILPRGEVGAGVLLISLDYGIINRAVGLAELSLLLNLALTGFFIWAVVWLIKPKGKETPLP